MLVVTEEAPVLLPIPLKIQMLTHQEEEGTRGGGLGVSTTESPRFQGGEGQREPGGPGEELWHQALWLRLESLRPQLLQHRGDLQPQLGKNSGARGGNMESRQQGKDGLMLGEDEAGS